ncbi:TPA: site-specific integrase [Streptococcus suis]|nr:site-specific integrase [Streptococcus suis]
MKITEVKKKNGTIVYRANVYLGTDKITGKKVKTSITGRTRTEVKKKISRAKYDFKTNGSTVYQETKIDTYKELADLWLESYKLTVKPQTFQSTRSLLNSHILPVFGDMKLDKITPSHIQKFANKLSAILVNYKVANSINRRILQHGVLMQLMPHNPAREVIIPKKQKITTDRVKFIDSKHLKELLDYMESIANEKYQYYYDNILYRFLLATGCRFGEAVALEWSDIDLEAGTVSITKTYNRQINKISTPKSKAGTRVISIDRKTVLLLKQYQNRQRLIFLDVGVGAPSVVFASPTLEYASGDVRSKALSNRCKEIGIPRFTFHAFRHTHASLLLNAGISYKELQYRLGHANIKMTLDIYGHLSKDKEKEAVSYYEKAINNL